MTKTMYKFRAPSGNTGAERQKREPRGFECSTRAGREYKHANITAHLDYLNLCGRTTTISLVEALVWAAFGQRFDWLRARPGTHGKFYDLNAVSPLGIMLSLDTSENGHGTGYRLSIPGRPLGQCKPSRLLEFCKEMRKLGARATRLDWAIDDYDRVLDIDKILIECREDRRHGYRQYTYYENGNRACVGMGRTIYLGSTSGEYWARIYDKYVESGGEINAIRFEVQAADEIANNLFAIYCGFDCADECAQHISRRAIGKYRFVEQTSSVLSRCPDLEWWKNFVDRVRGQVKTSVPRLPSMVSDKKRWIERSVVGTLALLVRCLGVENCLKWLSEEINISALKNKDTNEKYYRNWKDRHICDRESVGKMVNQFIEEIRFEDWSREVFSLA